MTPAATMEVDLTAVTVTPDTAATGADVAPEATTFNVLDRTTKVELVALAQAVILAHAVMTTASPACAWQA